VDALLAPLCLLLGFIAGTFSVIAVGISVRLSATSSRLSPRPCRCPHGWGTAVTGLRMLQLYGFTGDDEQAQVQLPLNQDLTIEPECA
jgi:hypothetical protein